MKNIIILISGAGTTMRAIVEAAGRDNWAQTANGRVAAVISNRPNAAGLQVAAGLGVATACVDHKRFATRPEFEAALAAQIAKFAADFGSVDLVCLAGFMRILSADFVRQFAGRMVNIHPSLLPHFPGLHTHQRALDAGHTQAGTTVHWVIPELDAGPIIAQAQVPVWPGDTADLLAQRVQATERLLYPRVVLELLKK